MREIVTLQLGSISNYVGTHFWNAQEEYFDYGESNESTTDELNHNVFYRAGETSSGVATYTPRTLIYDLKGGFGSMQKYNKLFNSNDNTDQVTWEQGVNRVDRTVLKSQYQLELDRMEAENDPNMNLDIIQQLDQTVNNWSDYNRIYYHPRSINPIVTHQMENDIAPFDSFTIGRESFAENEKETNSFEENLRFFVEECDNLQGFQILTDMDDGFGGFTEGLLSDLRDEFQKTPIITYGLSDSYARYRTERHKQKIVLNRAFGLVRLADLSSTFIPIFTPTKIAMTRCGQSPYLYFNELSRYHTSAIIAAAIETNLLPYRLKKNPTSMAETISRLKYMRNTKLASLSTSLPLPLSEHGYVETIESFKTPLAPILSFLDRQSPPSIVYSETIVARGLPNNMTNRDKYLTKLFTEFKDENDSLGSRFTLESALPLPDSYPRIFTTKINQSGFVTNDGDSSGNDSEPAHHVPVLTRLESGPALKATVDGQLKNLEKIRFSDFYEFSEGEFGLSGEDFLEMKESLIDMSDVYRDDMML